MRKTKLLTDEKHCKGCGICAAFCPRGVLELCNGKIHIRDAENCIACGLCEERCPDYSIWLEEVDKT